MKSPSCSFFIAVTGTDCCKANGQDNPRIIHCFETKLGLDGSPRTGVAARPLDLRMAAKPTRMSQPADHRKAPRWHSRRTGRRWIQELHSFAGARTIAVYSRLNYRNFI